MCVCFFLNITPMCVFLNFTPTMLHNDSVHIVEKMFTMSIYIYIYIYLLYTLEVNI